MTIFQTPDPISARIEIGAGDITVTAISTSQTTVTVTPRDENRPSDVQAAGTAEVDLANGILTVRTAKTWRRFTSKNDGAVEVTLNLPTGSSLYATTGFGYVHSDGELSETFVKSGMGDVRLDAVGNLKAKTGFGDISVDTAANAVVGTGGGAIRLNSIGGSATIKNATGLIEVAECTSDLHVRTAGGDISIGRAKGSVSASSAAGDISIGEVSTGSVGLSTAAGSISVGIKEGAAAWLELNSKFGSVRNGLTSTPAPAATESKVEVRARTGAGDITVDRAA